MRRQLRPKRENNGWWICGRLGFPTLPDVPFSRAAITLAGGRRGILVNSGALCHSAGRIKVDFRAQSGKHRRLRPRLRLQGC